MYTTKWLSRRAFLKLSAVAAVSAPAVISASALGADGTVAPSNRIAYGYIGCGGHGAGWNFD